MSNTGRLVDCCRCDEFDGDNVNCSFHGVIGMRIARLEHTVLELVQSSKKTGLLGNDGEPAQDENIDLDLVPFEEEK
jgi:hypothetical protein